MYIRYIINKSERIGGTFMNIKKIFCYLGYDVIIASRVIKSLKSDKKA